jgi:hypothetical protein
VRIQLEYNDDGHITAVASAVGIEHPDGSISRLGRVSKHGHHVIEVDSDEMSHAQDIEGLRRLVNDYRIAGHPNDPTLIRRSATS